MSRAHKTVVRGQKDVYMRAFGARKVKGVKFGESYRLQVTSTNNDSIVQLDDVFSKREECLCVLTPIGIVLLRARRSRPTYLDRSSQTQLMLRLLRLLEEFFPGYGRLLIDLCNRHRSRFACAAI